MRIMATSVLGTPTGLTLDHHVKILKKETGAFLALLPLAEMVKEELEPTGVVLDKGIERLYVSSPFNCRIYIFELKASRLRATPWDGTKWVGGEGLC